MMELIPGLIDDIGLECLVKVPYQDFSSVNSVCQRWKLQMAQPEFWRRRMVAGMTQQVIVITQAQKNDSSHQNPESKKHSGTPTYRLVLLQPESGSWTELPPVEEYLDAKWRRGKDIPGCRRSFFACASDFNQMAFVAGGHDDEKSALRSALAYNVVDDKWMWLPDMASDRDECKGVFNNGKFHVIGGYHTNMQGRFENSAEAFDVSNWRWDEVQDQFLATAMCPRTCVKGGDGRFYICHDSALVAVESSTRDTIAELPEDVRITSYVTSFKGNLLVIGSTGFNEPHRCWIFDLVSRKWTRIEAAEGFTGHVQSGSCLEM